MHLPCYVECAQDEWGFGHNPKIFLKSNFAKIRYIVFKTKKKVGFVWQALRMAGAFLNDYLGTQNKAKKLCYAMRPQRVRAVTHCLALYS